MSHVSCRGGPSFPSWWPSYERARLISSSNGVGSTSSSVRVRRCRAVWSTLPTRAASSPAARSTRPDRSASAPKSSVAAKTAGGDHHRAQVGEQRPQGVLEHQRVPGGAGGGRDQHRHAGQRPGSSTSKNDLNSPQYDAAKTGVTTITPSAAAHGLDGGGAARRTAKPVSRWSASACASGRSSTTRRRPRPGAARAVGGGGEPVGQQPGRRRDD